MKDPKDIMSILKRRAKSLGVSQQELAQQLGVSHPTIKRWLAGKGIQLEEMIQMMQALNVTWEDIAVAHASDRSKSFQYTIKQEQHFVANSRDLAFFDYLLQNVSPQKIRLRFGLSQKIVWRHLSNLEKIGLIEIHPKEKIKVLPDGEPVWRKNGPLAKAFRAKVIKEFCQTKPVSFSIIRCLRNDRKKLDYLLAEFLSAASAADRRARLAQEKPTKVGLLTGFTAFEPSLFRLDIGRPEPNWQDS